jgi:low affinity Fe/Cu permease
MADTVGRLKRRTPKNLSTACDDNSLASQKKRERIGLRRAFDETAAYVAKLTGRPGIFALALTTVVVWAVTGPVFNYSDTWQLVINTGTTIVTFLMVFLIQNSQNRDSAAIQIKLDELIRVGEVKNTFVGIEHLTEKEIEDLRDKCEKRAKAAQTR